MTRKWHRIWYISDPHFYHAKAAELRGVSLEENNEIICQEWCKVVKPSDVVWILGDLSVSKHEESLELIKKLPGLKHLIAGNHDPVHPMHKTSTKYFRRYLETFETVGTHRRMKWSGRNIFLNHFPSDTLGKYAPYALHPDESGILLHGHTHDSERIRGNMVNMCWEAWGRMVSQEEIIERVIPEILRRTEEDVKLPYSVHDFEMWAQGHFFIKTDENTIELPHVGESILIKNGDWYVVQAGGYLYRMKSGKGLSAWLKAREMCELGALSVMESQPEYTNEVLAYMADTEMEVHEPTVIEKLEELVKGDDTILAMSAAHVLLVCANARPLTEVDLDVLFKRMALAMQSPDLSNDKAEEET